MVFKNFTNRKQNYLERISKKSNCLQMEILN